jgi:hypothetical protein
VHKKHKIWGQHEDSPVFGKLAGVLSLACFPEVAQDGEECLAGAKEDSFQVPQTRPQLTILYLNSK